MTHWCKSFSHQLPKWCETFQWKRDHAPFNYISSSFQASLADQLSVTLAFHSDIIFSVMFHIIWHKIQLFVTLHANKLWQHHLCLLEESNSLISRSNFVNVWAFILQEIGGSKCLGLILQLPFSWVLCLCFNFLHLYSCVLFYMTIHYCNVYYITLLFWI